MSIFDIFRIRLPLAAPWEKYYKKKDLKIRIPDISMYDSIKISANKFPNHKAIVYENKVYTYKELLGRIDKLAISFKNYGVKPGEIVTICLPNLPEALISLYALNKLGVICNMTHPLSAEQEIKQAVESTHSKILIYTDMFYDKIENIIKDTCVEKVIFINPADSLNIFMKIGYHIKTFKKYKKIPKDKMFTRLNKFQRKYYNKNTKITKKFGKNTPAVILHSGGTSGTPKNVVVQNRAFSYGAKQTGDICLHLTPGDCCLAILPNFHGFGLSVCMHTALTLGCYTILVPRFDAKKFDILFNKTKPTVVLGVPTLFEALIRNNNVENLNLSFLKYAISGGDTLPNVLEQEVNDYLKKHNSKARITQGYGLSEALAAVTLAFGNINKPGSVGIPLPGNYVKIIDPATRKRMPYGKTGEIVINSKAFMMGYLNNESETNAALQIHDDGHIWLHTGDLGYMDRDGFIFYQGRQKRMIITSGYNVFPSHVEEIIENHPAVLQCTVVGVPHPYKQEVCKAFVVLKEGKRTLFIKQELKEYCKKNLAKYMVPQEIVLRRNLPKTKLGKVDVLALKDDNSGDDE